MQCISQIVAPVLSGNGAGHRKGRGCGETADERGRRGTPQRPDAREVTLDLAKPDEREQHDRDRQRQLPSICSRRRSLAWCRPRGNLREVRWAVSAAWALLRRPGMFSRGGEYFPRACHHRSASNRDGNRRHGLRKIETIRPIRHFVKVAPRAAQAKARNLPWPELPG